MVTGGPAKCGVLSRQLWPGRVLHAVKMRGRRKGGEGAGWLKEGAGTDA